VRQKKLLLEILILGLFFFPIIAGKASIKTTNTGKLERLQTLFTELDPSLASAPELSSG